MNRERSRDGVDFCRQTPVRSATITLAIATQIRHPFGMLTASTKSEANRLNVFCFSLIVLSIFNNMWCRADSPNQIRAKLHLAPGAPIPPQVPENQKGEIQQPDPYSGLDDCTSEAFGAAACEQEITDFEKQFKPLHSAPDRDLQLLASGYHNMGYTSDDPTEKAAWEKKERDLFEELFHSAKSAHQYYVASTMPAAGGWREECLRKALLLDPGNFNATRDLFDLYVDEGKMQVPFDEWKKYSVSSQARKNPFGLDVVRLSNGLVSAGMAKEAREVISYIVVANRGESPFERCTMFSQINLKGLVLDPTVSTEIEGLRSACTVEH